MSKSKFQSFVRLFHPKGRRIRRRFPLLFLRRGKYRPRDKEKESCLKSKRKKSKKVWLLKRRKSSDVVRIFNGAHIDFHVIRLLNRIMMIRFRFKCISKYQKFFSIPFKFRWRVILCSGWSVVSWRRCCQRS